MTSSEKEPANLQSNKENVYISGEEEREHEEKLMSEYYGLYGKEEKSNQTEPKPLNQLSENEISNQIDKEMNNDKENDDLE